MILTFSLLCHCSHHTTRRDLDERRANERASGDGVAVVVGSSWPPSHVMGVVADQSEPGQWSGLVFTNSKIDGVQVSHKSKEHTQYWLGWWWVVGWVD